MARIPAEVSGLLRDLAANLAIILGRNLVGIYQYGSLTQHAFNPKRSDIDCIVVTQRDLSAAQFRRLRGWLASTAKSNSWAATRLQMTFLIRSEILTMNSKACLYQFGKLQRIRSDGNPIIWMNVLTSGITLYGPRPGTFVPAITPESFLAALKREVGYIREEVVEKPDSEWRNVPFYRAYAVLTLCRILYSHATGTVVSKPRAAKWAIEHLPVELRDVVLLAQESDREGHAENRSSKLSLSPIRRLVDFAEAQLDAAPAYWRRRLATQRVSR
jgi:hypothetical protein